jgi:hypothetical protein
VSGAAKGSERCRRVAGGSEEGQEGTKEYEDYERCEGYQECEEYERHEGCEGRKGVRDVRGVRVTWKMDCVACAKTTATCPSVACL